MPDATSAHASEEDSEEDAKAHPARASDPPPSDPWGARSGTDGGSPYAWAWLTFGLPSGVLAVLLGDVVAPAVLGLSPVHDGPVDAGVFVVLFSVVGAVLWPWMRPGAEDRSSDANRSE
jgi:hypothetical protein